MFLFRLLSNIEDQCKNAHAIQNTKSSLCGLPYAVLRQQAIDVQVKLNLDSEQSSTNTEVLILPNSESFSTRFTEALPDGNNNESVLWVEKFRPKNFLELLSDDGTNRTLLRWLKLWDKVVFNKEVKRINLQNVNESERGNNLNYKPPPTEIIAELDGLNRPKQKCALLHGPPGLGKTTLAHIIAATAGYNVVEMNASDDRSLDKFQEKLIAATQMRSVLNQTGDERPNCLIIDEIDGALPVVVSFLVNLMTGAGNTNAKSRKKSKKDINLQRPVICICNDLYVSALRPLRQQALLIPFPPTISFRLAQRLQDIASKEKLRTDMTALLALAEKSDNDIRACLSTLQFFKSRGEYMRAVDVYKTNIGQKDTQKSLRTVWGELFQIPQSSKKRKFVSNSNFSSENGDYLQEENLSSMPARFWTMLRSVQACGDYEKMIQGTFENYLTIKFKDVKMQNVLCGNDWFQFFDSMQQEILHSQNYSLMGYLPYSFVASHLLFAASGSKPKINWPNVQYETNNRIQMSNNIIDSMIAEMMPSSRIFATSSTMVRDILPCLLKIIQTNLRPVNTQLYSPREKQELKHLVEILIAYNLSYVQEMNPDGQFNYRLDPELEEVAYFPNIVHNSVPYAIKQLIAHEVELERMRKKDLLVEEELPTTKNLKGNSITKEKKETSKLSENVPNHLQKLKAKDIQINERVPVDFFGRKIEKSETSKTSTSGSGNGINKGELVFSDVWFKFKEGFNNAVRRNIRVKDLL